MLWHVLWGPQPLLDAGLALPRPPSFLCALSLSPMTPIGSACPTWALVYLALYVPSGWAGSSLNPHQPREMFACSGIYSHSLWIKERMGIIFPVGRRACFLQGPSQKTGRAVFLGPLGIYPKADSGLGCLGQRGCARKALNQVPGERLARKQRLPPEGGTATFTMCSFSLCPSTLPPPGQSGPHSSPV